MIILTAIAGGRKYAENAAVSGSAIGCSDGANRKFCHAVRDMPSQFGRAAAVTVGIHFAGCSNIREIFAASGNSGFAVGSGKVRNKY